ncbi:hypothetical protein ACJX0J_031635, partial [Zea mays]
ARSLIVIGINIDMIQQMDNAADIYVVIKGNKRPVEIENSCRTKRIDVKLTFFHHLILIDFNIESLDRANENALLEGKTRKIVIVRKSGTTGEIENKYINLLIHQEISLCVTILEAIKSMF